MNRNSDSLISERQGWKLMREIQRNEEQNKELFSQGAADAKA